MRLHPVFAPLAGAFLIAGCSLHGSPGPATGAVAATSGTAPIDRLAVEYVKLVLAMGERDPGYVDAYYGPRVQRRSSAPPSCRRSARARELAPISTRCPPARLVASCAGVPAPPTKALLGRLDMLQGKKLTFDEESRVLYDAVAPHHPEAHYAALVEQIAALVPGEGPLSERFDAFQRRFTIPTDKLDAVFSAAIAGCRERTAARLLLPPGESFTVEYVTESREAATTGTRAATRASSRSTPTCRSSSTAPSTSPATRATPVTTSTTRCSRST